MFHLGYVVLGLFAGILSGLVGIGGGILIIPALVYIFKFSQHQAQGTTLALMLPPIGLLAVWTYYKWGYIQWIPAGLICLGFLFGGWMGARVAVTIPKETLSRVFGTVLVLVGLYMIFKK